MSCTACIYATNTTASQYSAGATIPFGSANHGINKNVLSVSGSSILIDGQGYYDFNCSITLSLVANSTVTVSLYKDGVIVPGATASATAEAAGVINLSIPAIIREQCCNSSSALTLVLSGGGATVYNVATVISKI